MGYVAIFLFYGFSGASILSLVDFVIFLYMYAFNVNHSMNYAVIKYFSFESGIPNHKSVFEQLHKKYHESISEVSQSFPCEEKSRV